MSNHLPTPQAANCSERAVVGADRGRGCTGVCGIGARSAPRPVFPRLPGGVSILPGHRLGQHGDRDDLSPDRRRVGLSGQRILEAGMRTLPYLAHLCSFQSRAAWAAFTCGPDPTRSQADTDLQRKQVYLNAPFFWGRAARSFSLCGLASLCFWITGRGAKTRPGDQRFARLQANLSGPGLIVFGITITFAAVDWLMSLQPKFHSTIYGPLVVTGQILSAHAVALIVWPGSRRPPIADVLSPKAFSDLGNLLFTFLVVWAYMVWFQFMLIWIANLPYEVIWYRPVRTAAGSGWRMPCSSSISSFRFPCLLLRDLKRHLPTLAKVAGLTSGDATGLMSITW